MILIISGNEDPFHEEYGLIKRILDKQANLFIKNPNVIDNYQKLKAIIVQDEWQTEVQALYQMLRRNIRNSEGFELAFKNRCAQRAKRNEGSCLSFSAMPNGACNRLYWQIAEVLFHPTTLKEMLAVLVPHVTKQVSWQRVRKEGTNDPSLRGNFTVRLVELDEVQLSEKPSLAMIQHLVMADKFVIDARTLTHLYFHEHVAYYHALSTQYALLASALYEHNREFYELRNHFLTGSNALETLICFVNDLCLSGTGITGTRYAATFAERAFENFINYLNALPEKERATLLSLANSHHTYTLNQAIDFLKKGGCVESAGKIIQMIVNNQDNQHFLSRQLATTVQYQQSILKRYNKHHPFSTISNSQNTILPEKLVESAFQQIIIQNFHDYLEFLISFPPSFYIILFQYAQIKFDFLSEAFHAALQDGILNEIQKKHFFNAILSNTQRFGLETVIPFVASYKNEDILLPWLTDLPKEQFLNFMRQRDSKGQTVLHHVVSTLETFRAILLLFPNDTTRLAALQECDYKGDSVLSAAIGNLEALQIGLQSLCNSIRLDAVKTILYEVNSESLRIILELLPMEMRFDVIQFKKNSALSFIHQRCIDAQYLQTLLAVLPDDAARLAAINLKDNQRNTVLHKAACNFESLQIILSFFDDADRLAAIEMIDCQGNTVLHKAASFSDSLRPILDSLPQSMRLGVVKIKNAVGDTVLYKAVHSPESLRVILACFPDDVSCFSLIQMRNGEGNTVLHEAIRSPESLRVMLALLPIHKIHFLVSQLKNHEGKTVLDCASHYPISLAIIRERCPSHLTTDVVVLPVEHTAVNASSFFSQAESTHPYRDILSTHFKLGEKMSGR